MRVTVGMIINQIGAGHSIEEVLANYPYLEHEDILQALQYAAWRVEEREIAFTPVTKSVCDPQTAEEALRMAEEQAANSNRKPISRLFGKHKGLFGGDGVAYQRAIRDESYL